MMEVRATWPRQDRRRWLGLAFVALASVLVPVAVALACNPQAYLTLDRAQYAPGQNVRVTGSFFKGNTAITVSLDRTAQSTTVTTTANGSFQTTFALPGTAPTGGYTVQAIGYENGDVIPGLPARASFSVAPAQSAAAPPAAGEPATSAAGAGEPATPAASEPTAPAAQPAASTAVRPTPRPSTGAPATGFREPSVISEPSVQASRPQRSARQPSTASGDRATVNGRSVFGGSVAPTPSASFVPATTAPASAASSEGSRAAVRPRGSSQSSQISHQAAEQTATDDVWSAQSSGRSPSVVPAAGDGVAVSSPRAGSQLALGILLLAAGVLALAGGLAVGEARRRRVRAR